MASQNTTALNKKKSSFRKSVFSGDSKDMYIICGNLLKNTPSNLVTPWQTRYFAASGHYLKYYKTEAVAGRKDYCLGAIDMNLCEVRDAVDNIFMLMDKEVEITTLKAKDNEEAIHWVNTLRSMNQANTGGGEGHPEAIEEGDEQEQNDDGGNESDDARDEAFPEQTTTASSLLTPLDENDEDAMSISSTSSPTLTTTESETTIPSLPDKNHLSSKLSKEELKSFHQSVPKELKPKKGEVNELSNKALSTAQIGQERKVARRRSITSRKCCAGLLPGVNECSNFHFRDAPFCHTHANLDPEAARRNAGGTTELTDELNKALEVALDHSGNFSSEATKIGEEIKASLPEALAAEFPDPIECFQLKKQFNAFLGNAENNSGIIKAQDILTAAERLGDEVDPNKVNLEWATTIVEGVCDKISSSSSNQDASTAAGIDLNSFMAAIARMRRNMGVDKKSMDHVVSQLSLKSQGIDTAVAAQGEGGNDSDEDNEEEGDTEESMQQWEYPVEVPEGAPEGVVLTVPLPGGEVAYAPTEEAQVNSAGVKYVKVPMSPKAISTCIRQAVFDAAGGDASAAAEGGGGGIRSSMAAQSMPIPGAPSEPGMGAVYAAKKGKESFAMDCFLALREASALSVDLPPMEGWMLKRGDKFAKGSLNSWKLRYFRLEGSELVYYDKKPGLDTAESHFTVKKEGVAGAMDEAKNKAKAEGREATDKELATALVSEQNDETFDDNNCKGAISMSEIVDVQFSTKTAVSISGAKLFVGKIAPGASQPFSDLKTSGGSDTSPDNKLKGAELADSMICFKVTSAKMRRYVLAVPYDQVIQVMVMFAKHVHFARASLRLRREFGSGVKQGLTLAERLQWAASTHAGKISLAILIVMYNNKFLREQVLGFPLFSIGVVTVTPGKIVTAMVVTKTAHDLYIKAKYTAREKKFGVKWQYKKDIFDCPICNTKFPTIAMRIEYQKHHCCMCGRVVCHACSSTRLFYENCGSLKRTCDFCISNNGPPENCKANAKNQKSLFTLMIQQQRSDAAKKAAGMKNGNKKAKNIQALNKGKVAEFAEHCDLGIVPNSINDNKKVNTMEYIMKFKVFGPEKKANDGETFEVTLPDGVNKVLTLVKGKGEQSIEVGFGKDGVFYCIPPNK